MPAADFSEFSYGYAVVRQAEDLLTAMGAGVMGAPTLPPLLTENTVGYDAELVTVDFALFLQFKRSFFVSPAHSRGVRLPNGEPHCTWAHWNAVHYRFDIDTDSNQFHAMRGYQADIALGYRSGLFALRVIRGSVPRGRRRRRVPGAWVHQVGDGAPA